MLGKPLNLCNPVTMRTAYAAAAGFVAQLPGGQTARMPGHSCRAAVSSSVFKLPWMCTCITTPRNLVRALRQDSVVHEATAHCAAAVAEQEQQQLRCE